MFDEQAEDYEEDEAVGTDGQWEGQTVGTGRPRQGNSGEIDRGADPRVELEEKELGKIFLDADDEADVKAERRQRRAKPPKVGRDDGSPIAPGGVPKSDHVANPLDATQQPEIQGQ
jgi:hypothetical protein